MTGYKVSLVAIVMTGESETGYTVSLVANVMTGESVTGYKASLVVTVMRGGVTGGECDWLQGAIGSHCHNRGG